MRFETINERGSAEELSEDGRYRFVYGNDFYGSCTFSAKVFLGEQKSLLLRESSIVVEEYELKKGDVRALLGLSITFFKRMLVRQS